MVHRAQLHPEVTSGWALDSTGQELLKRMHAGLVHTPGHTRSGRVEKAGALTVYQTQTSKSLSVQRQYQHSINSPWEGASQASGCSDSINAKSGARMERGRTTPDPVRLLTKRTPSPLPIHRLQKPLLERRAGQQMVSG